MSPAKPNGGSDTDALVGQVVEQLASQPSKKWMLVTHVSAPPRKVCWYDPSPTPAMDQLLRATFRLPAGQQFVLTDDECMPVALSSSLPSGKTFELVPVEVPSGAGSSALPPLTVVVVDPISTGAVLAHHIVNKRGLQVVAVWSEVVPDELKAFVAHGMEVSFAGRIQHVAGQVRATAAAVRALNVRVLDVIVGC